MGSAAGCVEILRLPGTTLIYGEAGAGKTVLSVEAVKANCADSYCIYVSTEGTGFVKRLEAVGAPLENVEVVEVFDMADLVHAVEHVAVRALKRRTGLIVVDSVNAPFRAEAGSTAALQQLMYVAALLYAVASTLSIPVFMTGQVHEVEGVVEAVGLSAIAPWLDRVLRVERLGPGLRRLVGERGLNLECEFEIKGDGVKWLRRLI